MDQRKRRKELSQEIRKKIIDKHVKAKRSKTISKQLDVPVTTVAHIIQKCKILGIVANPPGRGRRRKIDDKSKRRLIRMTVDRPKDWYKTMFKQIHMVHKPDNDDDYSSTAYAYNTDNYSSALPAYSHPAAKTQTYRPLSKSVSDNGTDVFRVSSPLPPPPVPVLPPSVPHRMRELSSPENDTDNDPDRCSVAVWSLESCHTDRSPATNDAGNQGKHRVTKRRAALSNPMFTLVTILKVKKKQTLHTYLQPSVLQRCALHSSCTGCEHSGRKAERMVTRVNIGLLSAALRLVTRCLPWLPVKTSLNRCHTRRFSDVYGESSDQIKFWTFFPDQRQHSRGLIAAACHTGRYR
ncbi:unnamed protein product [Ranitomeya imitator]|uniref:SoHo domain-containing protein n=1 Tax=Ranitomeya imitator TaxID=111125 RepID=A0ABN9M1B4_9NEOB|nr:unnamed protein product [Ranitomeya imitator]